MVSEESDGTGCVPRIMVAKSPTEMKEEQDLRTIKALVKTRFEGVELQCRYRLCRVGVVAQSKFSPLAGINRAVHPFVCETECKKRGLTYEIIAELVADMVESLR